MINFSQLQSKHYPICIVGLGYVGLPLAIELSKTFSVIGFDVKEERINELKNGFDRTREVGEEKLKNSTIEYSTDPKIINSAKFIIIAVPTPVDKNNQPDLLLVEKATETVGKNLSKDSVVVYESTVYPGVTEEICLPILEKFSGLKAGVDFKVGYSPERINPGDSEHTIDRVVKIVSGMDEESLNLIAEVYGSITQVYKATSIKVAESAKVIENTQRDINIALMNELSLIFERMNISIYDVLDAAGTKWNFLKFYPGLVGGHCIGVDPYYLTHKAQALGYEPEVILSGRRVNDRMPHYLAEKIIKTLVNGGRDLKVQKFVLGGITFKENIPDARNSKSAVIYDDLKKNNLDVVVFDPMAYADEVKHEYKIELIKEDDLPKADVLIIAVAHDEFKKLFFANNLARFVNPGGLVVDIKKILVQNEVEKEGYQYLTL